MDPFGSNSILRSMLKYDDSKEKILVNDFVTAWTKVTNAPL
jgi:catalase (peroxidase I)